MEIRAPATINQPQCFVTSLSFFELLNEHSISNDNSNTESIDKIAKFHRKLRDLECNFGDKITLKL